MLKTWFLIISRKCSLGLVDVMKENMTGKELAKCKVVYIRIWSPRMPHQYPHWNDWKRFNCIVNLNERFELHFVCHQSCISCISVISYCVVLIEYWTSTNFKKKTKKTFKNETFAKLIQTNANLSNFLDYA